MMRFPYSLSAWNTPAFRDVFKHEVEQMDAALLPLQQGLTVSSHVADRAFSIMVIGVHDDADAIHVKTGIFYAGIIAGCSCADDPTPINELAEYCEVLFAINKKTADLTLSIAE